jgi:hypothetical protein
VDAGLKIGMLFMYIMGKLTKNLKELHYPGKNFGKIKKVILIAF